MRDSSGASRDLDTLIGKIAELERRLANSLRHGTIHEVKDGYVRVRMDEPQGEGGQPFLSPWLPQGDTHSGNVREEQPFKVGQNVTMLCPGGDPGHATLLPFSPNDDNRRPDHANDQDHAYQFGDLKLRRNGETYHIELGDKHVRIHKDKGITGRVGVCRFAAHEQGAKIKVSPQHWAVVTKQAPHLRISEPWMIAPDPIPDDDEEIEDRQEGG